MSHVSRLLHKDRPVVVSNMCFCQTNTHTYRTDIVLEYSKGKKQASIQVGPLKRANKTKNNTTEEKKTRLSVTGDKDEGSVN